MAPDVLRRWREAGAVAAVCGNRLESEGIDDLAAVMRGAPAIAARVRASRPA